MVPRDPPVFGTLGLYYKRGYHGSLALGPLHTSPAPGYFFLAFESKRNFTLMMTDTSVFGTFACLSSL